MRRQILPDNVIKEVLSMIDSGDYSQAEIAARFNVSQGTISRYNRIKRMQFNQEKYVRLISELNYEILDLKDRYRLNTSKERKVPSSFEKAKIILWTNDYVRYLGLNNKTTTITLEGFVTRRRADAVDYMIIHPEYHMYDVVETYSGMKMGSNFRNSSMYIVCQENFGKILAKDRIEIKEILYSKPANKKKVTEKSDVYVC